MQKWIQIADTKPKFLDKIIKAIIVGSDDKILSKPTKHMRTRLYPTSEKQVFRTIGVPDPLSPELDAHTTRVTALISDNFSQIRAFEMTGLGRRNLLDVINVNVSLFGIEDLESIKDQLVSYFIVQKRLLKLQASIGFIYQTSDQELGYFRPSPNSGTVLQTPVLIPDVKTLIKTISMMRKGPW